MVQLSATRRSCINILRVSLVSFAAVTLCVASQRLLIVVSVYFISKSVLWIHPCTITCSRLVPEHVEIKVYRIIILPVILYLCEAWSLILEESRLRMFENRVLKRIFGCKREEVKLEKIA
jgi:hypothetical protein